MRRSLITLLLLSFGLSAIHAQGRKEGDRYLLLYQQAEKLYGTENANVMTDSLALLAYSQVIAILEKTPIADSLLFDSYLKSGILDMTGGKNEMALSFFLRSIALKRRSGHLPDQLLFRPYLYAGSCLYELYDLDSSLYFYKLAEDLIRKYPDLPEPERLYNKTGVLYYETGDYRRSILYFSKALVLVQSRRPSDVNFIVNYKNNIASALLKLQDYDQAAAIYQSLLPYHINRDELLYNTGTTFLDAGKPAMAIRFLQNAGTNSQARYNNLARAWLQLKNYDSANVCLRLALAIGGKKKNSQKDQDRGLTFKYLGDLMMARKDPEKALGYYQEAIIQIDRDFNDASPKANPSSFYGWYNSFLLFDALTAKAAAFYSMGGQEDLVQSFLTYGAALSLARHVERMYNSDEARLFLVKKADSAYKETINLGIRLYGLLKDTAYLEKVFGYMEESKASVLQAGLLEPGPGSVEGAAREMLQEEKKLKGVLGKLNVQLAHTIDSQTLVAIQAQVRDLSIRISGLEEKLDESPGYYRIKFNNKHLGIPVIQRWIGRDEAALLSYYYTEDKLICYYITGDRFGCVITDRDPGLVKNILQLRKGLDAGGAGDRQALRQLIKELSRQLLAPVFAQIKGKKHLIIIPYNEIAYVPFEILSQSGNDRPLLYDHSISYDYSANFLDPGKHRLQRPYEVLAMAPFNGQQGQDAAFPVLRSSAAEVQDLNGKILLGEAATKEHFLAFLPRYPVIHLATHARVNDLDPLGSFIAFYRRGAGEADTLHRLYEQEIYHLGMDSTALVILSACETGNGVVINGEGIISLSRAFSYAGCKSVITSLWKADDAATAYIGRKVHSYLRQGLAIDRALQMAKIDYLEDPAIDTRYKIPSYWANLVLAGDFQPVTGRSFSGWRLMAAVLLAAVAAAFIFIFIRKKRVRRSAPGGISRNV